MPRLRAAHSLALLMLGLALRVVLIVTAENRIDADESTVGVMALDILEGAGFPVFFYGNAYNGGGAMEAYLAAGAFAIFGPSAVVLKFCMLGLWAGAAWLFMDLCHRTMSARQAVSAVAFFVLATPFFLEWNLKARGGFAETVLFSVALLWIAAPPNMLAKRTTLQPLIFGVVSGLGLWASEMLTPMVALAGVWLLIRRESRDRWRICALLFCGFALGSVGLLAYNVTHDWQHVRSLVVYSVFSPSTETRTPLSLSQLRLTAGFVLGSAWPLLLGGLAVGAVRLVRDRSHVSLGHVVLVHLILYVLAYCLSGNRALSVPPSRVLYAVYPGVAILLAYAVDLAPASRRATRILIAGSIAVWLVATAVPTLTWMTSRVPRETNSWRGSWAMTNSDRLYDRLVEEEVDIAYASFWTAWSLRFSVRARMHRDPDAADLRIHWRPTEPKRDTKVAFIMHTEARLAYFTETSLQKRGVDYERQQWEDLTLLLVESPPPNGFRGIPRKFRKNDWIAAPAVADGFN